MNAGLSPVKLALEPEFRLGGLEVRPSRRELVDGETRSLLEPRVMQVLVALAKRRGEVVSRDELIAACWDGRIVGDDAINACVAKVRRAGEAARAYEIETIPRVGYRLTARGGPDPEKPVASAAVLLAVLPFENLSDDTQLGFFADGVSEEILNALARRASVRVVGRSSSFQFRGPDKAIPNVARQLGVSHVLDGAVRRSGDQVRVSAQLIESATQAAVWADRFERRLSDVFDLQDEVALAVAQAMNHTLIPARRLGAVDPISYELYLRGASFPEQNNRASIETHLAILEEAVRRSPAFSEAWGKLAFVRANLAFHLGGGEAQAARAQAGAEAARALSLDPHCAAAAIAMARTTPMYGHLVAQDQWLRKAMAWAPHDSFATRIYAIHVSSVGRCRETVRLMRQAVALDPLYVAAVNSLGSALREAGRLDEAEAVFTEAMQRWPEFEAPVLGQVFTLAYRGEFARAGSLVERRDLGPYAPGLHWLLEALQDPSGGRAIGTLRRQVERSGRVSLHTLMVAGHLGHADEALDLAARAELGPRSDAPDPRGTDAFGLPILFMAAMPQIRCDRRFVGLCGRLGLVEYWLATDTWPDCVEEVASYYDFKTECRRVAGRAAAT